jgi:transposase
MKPMTIREFFKQFPTDDSCLAHIFECRFGADFVCPKCEKAGTWHKLASVRAYSCSRCGNHIHPTVGTPFEDSRTSLQLWFYAIYLFTQTRHGVSAKELQRQLGVTYKCAWRMGHQIREHMADVDDENLDPLRGHIEIDESHFGGIDAGSKGPRKGDKTIVLGMMERNGDVVTVVVPSTRRDDLLPIIEAHVEEGAVISTDKLPAYKALPEAGFDHMTVTKRTKGGRIIKNKGRNHTNSIEGYWRILKSSIASTHIHVSPEHIEKYLGEFEYRHNNRKENPAGMFPQLISTYPDKEEG